MDLSLVLVSECINLEVSLPLMTTIIYEKFEIPSPLLELLKVRKINARDAETCVLTTHQSPFYIDLMQ